MNAVHYAEFIRRIRVLYMNLWFGWTTVEQRYEVLGNGYCAVTLPTQKPVNPHTHPLLRKAFDDGVEMAVESILRNQEENEGHAIAATYAAINRDEMGDVFEDCHSLELVTSSGVVILA